MNKENPSAQLSKNLSLNQKIRLFVYKKIEVDGKTGKNKLEGAYKTAKIMYDNWPKERKAEFIEDVDKAIDGRTEN